MLPHFQKKLEFNTLFYAQKEFQFVLMGITNVDLYKIYKITRRFAIIAKQGHKGSYSIKRTLVEN